MVPMCGGYRLLHFAGGHKNWEFLTSSCILQMNESEIGQGGSVEIFNTGDIRFQCHDKLIQWNYCLQNFSAIL